jgi:hypothetical protein
MLTSFRDIREEQILGLLLMIGYWWLIPREVMETLNKLYVYMDGMEG